jgi:hypothetical protein
MPKHFSIDALVPLRPSAIVPDGEGAALVGLEGVAPELSELAVLIAELAEQAERGAATATEAISSVMDLEISTGGPFLAGGRSLGAAIRRRRVMGCLHIRTSADGWARIRPATDATPDRFMRGTDSIRRLLLFFGASSFWRSLFLNDGFIVGRAVT